MDEKLQAAYEALQAADAAGNVEDANKIADYIESLKAAKPSAEPVVEKESPEAMGGIGATIGGVGAAGDVLYSKGRPLFRIAEKAMGMDSSEPTIKPRTFQDPAAVAEQAIARRTATAPDVTGSPSAVRNWAGTQHEGDFLGGGEYKEADRIKKEAMAFEKSNPTQKVLPGSLLAVPEEEAQRLAQQRAELAAQEDIAKQAEVRKVAQTRAERLSERAELKGKSNKLGAAKGAGSLLGKAALPVVGGYELGSQGAQAYNRLSRPDLTTRDVLAGGANIVGAGAGAMSMVPSKYRIPAAIISQGAGTVANWLDKRNPRDEEVETPQKAEGGLIHLAGGGKAGAAKKLFDPVATKILKASEALAPHEGKWLNVTQSDRMRSTGGDLGGPGFSKFQLEKPEYAAAQAAWGVGKKPTASGIVNVNKKFGDQAIWTPMIGGETQHHSNQHVYDALTDEFKRQSSMGKLPKELQERMNARLASAPATKGMFPAEFDIGNPEHLAQYGDTFNRRGALSTVMSGEGVGGAKGRIIDYPGIMQEMTDPMTVGAPTHSLGTRLFTLNNEIEHRPDLHSAFPYILKGEDQGVAFAPVPKELGIQDFINQFKDFKGREPGYYDLVRTTPSQQVTEKYLRSLQEAGHAEGGHIEGYAPGGKIGALAKLAGKAKFLEPSAVKERMFHGTTQNISAFDPTKKANTVGDFNRGMTFVSPNPKLASYYAGKGEGANVMPVHVQVKNPFDYENPEHVQGLANRIVESGNYHPSMAAEKAQQYAQDLSSGNWGNLEQANVMRAAQDLGHDAMYMQEHGVKNLGIFDPKRIKSAIGNEGTYDVTSSNIAKKQGGLVAIKKLKKKK